MTNETPATAIARLLTDAGFDATAHETHVVCSLNRNVTGIEVQAALGFEVSCSSFDMPNGRIVQLVGPAN